MSTATTQEEGRRARSRPTEAICSTRAPTPSPLRAWFCPLRNAASVQYDETTHDAMTHDATTRLHMELLTTRPLRTTRLTPARRD